MLGIWDDPGRETRVNEEIALGLGLVVVGKNFPFDLNYLLYIFGSPSVLGVDSVNVFSGWLNFELVCSPFSAMNNSRSDL